MCAARGHLATVRGEAGPASPITVTGAFTERGAAAVTSGVTRRARGLNLLLTNASSRSAGGRRGQRGAGSPLSGGSGTIVHANRAPAPLSRAMRRGFTHSRETGIATRAVVVNVRIRGRSTGNMAKLRRNPLCR